MGTFKQFLEKAEKKKDINTFSLNINLQQEKSFYSAIAPDKPRFFHRQ